MSYRLPAFQLRLSTSSDTQRYRDKATTIPPQSSYNKITSLISASITKIDLVRPCCEWGAHYILTSSKYSLLIFGLEQPFAQMPRISLRGWRFLSFQKHHCTLFFCSPKQHLLRNFTRHYRNQRGSPSDAEPASTPITLRVWSRSDVANGFT